MRGDEAMKSKAIATVLIIILILLSFTGCPPSYKDLSTKEVNLLRDGVAEKMQDLKSWDMWHAYTITVAEAGTEDGVYQRISCYKFDSIAFATRTISTKIGNTWYDVLTLHVDGMRYYEDKRQEKLWKEPGDNPYETLADELFPIMQEVMRYCFEQQELDEYSYSGHTMNGAPELIVEISAPIEILHYGRVERIYIEFKDYEQSLLGNLISPGTPISITFTLEHGASIYVCESSRSYYMIDSIKQQISRYE